jgi:hypothetical protein
MHGIGDFVLVDDRLSGDTDLGESGGNGLETTCLGGGAPSVLGITAPQDTDAAETRPELRHDKGLPVGSHIPRAIRSSRKANAADSNLLCG